MSDSDQSDPASDHGAPHIVYFFDRGFEACTLVSLWSVLDSTPGPLRVTLHPTDPSQTLADDLAAIGARWTAATLAVQEVDLGPWRHLPRGRLPLAARSRLLLPRLHRGRVLYLDGDAIALTDLTPLWQTPLHGACIAAAVAPGVQVNLARGAAGDRKLADKMARRSARLDGIDMHRYFNNGVMVLDLDRIRALGLDARMADIDETVHYTSRDQDFMNVVFRDHTHLIDPRWNSGWGNGHTLGRGLPAELEKRFAASRDAPAILHFTGFEKPWHAPKPPFRWEYVLKPRRRRDRARYWAAFQERAREIEALVGRALWP